MKKIIVFTQAYNAEKTLPRTIDSILAQTYDDWLYYCVDNGSTDLTGEIIHKYAKKDSRIVPLANKQNHVWEKGNYWIEIIKQFENDDFLCFIDADDEYRPDFFKTMLLFVEKENLEIAVCGNDFINTLTGKLQGARKLDHNLIIDGKGFDMYFPVYHQFMRTWWGKIISISVLRKLDYKSLMFHTSNTSYGHDTLYMVEAFRNTLRIGIHADSLHIYYINLESASYQLDGKRIESDRILDDVSRKFLLDKCDIITPQNNNFLNVVYLNAINDTLKVMLDSQISVGEKIAGLHDVFTSENTQRVIIWQGMSEERRQLFKAVADWILIQKKGSLKKQGEDDPVLTELEIALNHALMIPENEQFSFLVDIKRKRPKSYAAANIDAKICEITEKNILLKDVSASLSIALSSTIVLILKNEFSQALDEFISVSDKLEIDSEDEEAYLMLGQNLAAAADDSEAYVYFIKVWVSFLLDNSRFEEAGKVLNEFLQLLPGDEDFIALKERILE